MTEEEWLGRVDGTPMLDYLSSGRPITTDLSEHKPFPNGFRVSDRKMRLFACGSCRSFWLSLKAKRCRKAVQVGERYADGLASEAELERARELAAQAVRDGRLGDPNREDPWAFMQRAAQIQEARRQMAWHAVAPPSASDLVPRELVPLPRRGEYGAVVANVLRCVLGTLPFRLVVADPAWLTAAAVSIAAAIYDGRAFDRLPILADALEEAGCADADVLLHCRTPGEHVRGCWVVDLVLGKA